MVNLAKNNEMREAKKAITKSIRDLLNLKITVPLGNPNLKMVHTNSFVNCDIPAHSVVIGNPAQIYARNDATENYVNFCV